MATDGNGETLTRLIKVPGPQLRRRWLWLAFVLVLLVTVVLAVVARYTEDQLRQVRLETIRERTDQLAETVEERLRVSVENAHALAREAPTLDWPALKARLRELSLNDPLTTGYTVAFASDVPHPAGYAEDAEMHPVGRPLLQPGGCAPFFRVRDRRIVPVEYDYRYTDTDRPENEWYVMAARSGQPGWSPPAYGRSSREEVVSFSVPMWIGEGEDGGPRRVAGIANVSIPLERGLRTPLREGSLTARVSYAMVVRGEDGLILADTRSRVDVDEPGTLFDRLAPDRVPEARDRLEGALLSEAGTGVVSMRSIHGPVLITGRAMELDEADWRLVLVVPTIEPETEDLGLFRMRLATVLLGIASLVLGLFLVLRVDRLRDRDWARIGRLISIAAGLGVALIWWMTSRRPVESIPGSGETVVIRNFPDVRAYLLDEVWRPHCDGLPEETGQDGDPIFVDTGLLVDAIQFEDAYNVRIGGRAWQTWAIEDLVEFCGVETDALVREDGTFDLAGLGEDLRLLGFVDLAPDPEGMVLEETRRALGQNAARVHLAWRFRAVLRLDFDYGRFPFDSQDLMVRMRPADPPGDLGREVFLVPDKQGYPSFVPAERPGLEPGIVLPGWTTEEAQFNFVLTPKPPDLAGAGRLPDRYDLAWHLRIERHILNPFITYLVPVAVVLVLLYGVLVSMTKIEGKCSIAGFNTFGALDLCAAFIFVIVLAHVDMRSGLPMEDLTYLEYIYFIAYVVILLVAANAIAFTATDDYPILEYRDNLIATILYWPTFAVLALAATLVLLA